MVGDIEHPVIGRYRGITRPIKFGRTPGPDPFAAPVFQEPARTGDGPVSPLEVRKA
jgi:hypothetical protein